LLEVGTGFHPELTGRENIYLNGAILGMGREEIKRKFDEIVAFAEVEKFLDTPVKRYSSGMYVRLAFAVAAHLEPEILIVDEVLAVGDVQFQKKCLGKMEEVGKEGRTVIFVSHNMATVSHLCNRGIVLDKGSLSLQSDTKSCIDAYVNQASIRLGSIMDHKIVKDNTITAIEALINGSSKDLVHLETTKNPLNISIKFKSHKSCRISMEILLKDREGHTIAVCVPGHIDSERYVHYVTDEEYIIEANVVLPKLNKGTYGLEISLTDPGHQVYILFPCATEIDVAGFKTSSGRVFEQSLTGSGFQVLDGKTNIKYF